MSQNLLSAWVPPLASLAHSYLISSQRIVLSHMSQFHSLTFNVSPKPVSAQVLAIWEVLSLSGRIEIEKTFYNSKLPVLSGFGSKDVILLFLFPSQAVTNKRNLNEKICETVSDLPWGASFSVRGWSSYSCTASGLHLSAPRLSVPRCSVLLCSERRGSVLTSACLDSKRLDSERRCSVLLCVELLCSGFLWRDSSWA